jgi:hypothetical protein
MRWCEREDETKSVDQGKLGNNMEREGKSFEGGRLSSYYTLLYDTHDGVMEGLILC